MARAGDEVVNPITGQRLVFVRTAAETNGELLEMESFYKPGGWPPVFHYHPVQRERFEVLAGTLTVQLQDKQQRLGPGDVLHIEPGMVHEMWNHGEEWAHVNWQVRPALNTEQFFETAFGLAANGRVNAKGIPNVLQVAVMAQAYDTEFRLATPPRVVQKIVFGVLAPLARLLGYRASYARYTTEQRNDRGAPMQKM